MKHGLNMFLNLNMFDHGLTMIHLVMQHGYYMVRDIIAREILLNMTKTLSNMFQ